MQIKIKGLPQQPQQIREKALPEAIQTLKQSQSLKMFLMALIMTYQLILCMSTLTEIW